MKPQETKVESTVRRQLGPGGATRESSASNPGSKPSHKTASPELQARIAERAYNLYEKRGHQAGHDLEDWLQAEREVLQQEEAKQIGRLYRQELWNTGNLEIADRICGSGAVFHNNDSLTPDFGRGPSALKQIVTMYRTAFPDAQVKVEDLVAEGDKVVIRWTSRGTNKGNLGTIGPTGKSATMTGTDILRITGGKIQEVCINWDSLGLLQQLGVAQLRSQAAAR